VIAGVCLICSYVGGGGVSGDCLTCHFFFNFGNFFFRGGGFFSSGVFHCVGGGFYPLV